MEVDAFNYLDIFLFVASSQTDCHELLKEFEAMCRFMCCFTENCCCIPSYHFLTTWNQREEFHIIHTRRKAEEGAGQLTQFLNESVPRVKKWQSIAGSLNHIAKVFSPGLVYLSSVCSPMAGILSQD